MGGIEYGEVINLISLCLKNKMNCEVMQTLQIDTYSWLAPPPTFYPLIDARRRF